MYRMDRQMRIEDFVFPYGQLDKNNEWVKLADLLPWDEAEEIYEFFDIAVVNDITLGGLQNALPFPHIVW